ncbi:MAG: hypothetical protein HYY63_02710 [Elusimicrobia bacterium]|nr:hypothetical protein [Elusimicrobiota bacterium]
MKTYTFIREHSSGGLVLKGIPPKKNPFPQARKTRRRLAQILMVRVRNLEGAAVWTFPNGWLRY